MNSFLLAGATWLHLLATVTVIGLYIVTYWAVTPAVMAAPERASLSIQTYRRTKPLVLGSWLIFIVTGFGLMLLNPSYMGIGRFDNPWSILMLVKHVVVFAMILMTGFTDICPAIGMMRPLETALAREDPAGLQAVLRTLHSREGITMALGAAVLLLTALAGIA
jgi:uncharacterized membrane protein